MLPRLGTSKLISTWIWITIATTLLAAVVPGVAWWLALSPDRVWHGEVWRLVTWVFLHGGPMLLVWSCIVIYRIGDDLVGRWGERGLARFLIKVLGGAALVTCGLAWLSDTVWHHMQRCGFAVGDALVIAWARQFPNRVLRLQGLLDVYGRNLILITVAITCAHAIFYGPLAMIPELATCALAYYVDNR